MCVMDSKIIGIGFSPIHPVMVVCTENGYLNMVAVRPCENWKMKNKCFAKIEMTNNSFSSSVKMTSFSFELILKNYLP